MKAMRREIEGTDVAAAPVVSEGGRSVAVTTPTTRASAWIMRCRRSGLATFTTRCCLASSISLSCADSRRCWASKSLRLFIVLVGSDRPSNVLSPQSFVSAFFSRGLKPSIPCRMRRVAIWFSTLSRAWTSVSRGDRPRAGLPLLRSEPAPSCSAQVRRAASPSASSAEDPRRGGRSWRACRAAPRRCWRRA
jgi:hypothetical protein